MCCCAACVVVLSVLFSLISSCLKTTGTRVCQEQNFGQVRRVPVLDGRERKCVCECVVVVAVAESLCCALIVVCQCVACLVV